MFFTMIRTWNVTNEGSQNSPFSKSKVTRHESERSTMLCALSNVFLGVGNEWNCTYKVDMVAGD